MSDPEDMMMLVLGMQKSKFYDDLYSEGFSAARKENVSSWFDSLDDKKDICIIWGASLVQVY